MAEIKHQRIKSLYGELVGLLSQLPLPEKSEWVPEAIGKMYNSTVDELIQQSDSNYERLKLTSEDTSEYSSEESDYKTVSIRTKLGSLVKKLELEYSFGDNKHSAQQQPVIVTVNQNQEVTLSITPLQQIIDSSLDEEIKAELRELKEVLETTKDVKSTSNILSRIQQKSWEIFIAILPYVLERLGKQ